ncbi:MAG TPA: hypothetical protein VMW35_12245 [Myxococcota bacterium]|nr:hypothetical protein [Myxococcota bacterium]
MLLAQSKAWRATCPKGATGVVLSLQKEGLVDDELDLRDLRFELPLARWNALVKNVLRDRKLLGGILLDFASHKDLVATVIGNDRLLAELQRVALEATAALVEAEVLALCPAQKDGPDAG